MSDIRASCDIQVWLQGDYAPEHADLLIEDILAAMRRIPDYTCALCEKTITGAGVSIVVCDVAESAFSVFCHACSDTALSRLQGKPPH